MDIEELNKLILEEGDRKEFEFEGFQCLIHRVPNMEHLCGYINMKPMMDIHLDDVLNNVETHGGITYQGELEHLGKEGFWIGFDCAHHLDLVPEIFRRTPSYFDEYEYRDMEYVESILKYMVGQMLYLRRRNSNELRS